MWFYRLKQWRLYKIIKSRISLFAIPKRKVTWEIVTWGLWKNPLATVSRKYLYIIHFLNRCRGSFARFWFRRGIFSLVSLQLKRGAFSARKPARFSKASRGKGGIFPRKMRPFYILFRNFRTMRRRSPGGD